MSAEDGQFNRYDLPTGTGPHNLIVDEAQNIWYAANRKKHIGVLSPSTGRTVQITMPDRKARDPHTLVFDAAGDIWFTVQKGNFIGKLTVQDNGVELIQVPTRKSRPYGIIVDRDNSPWAAAFGNNTLLQMLQPT